MLVFTGAWVSCVCEGRKANSHCSLREGWAATCACALLVCSKAVLYCFGAWCCGEEGERSAVQLCVYGRLRLEMWALIKLFARE